MSGRRLAGQRRPTFAGQPRPFVWRRRCLSYPARPRATPTTLAVPPLSDSKAKTCLAKPLALPLSCIGVQPMSQTTLTPHLKWMHSIDDAQAEHRTGCVKGSIIGQDENTGRVIVVPLCCKSWNCPKCADRLMEHWVNVAVAGQPDRFLTLTGDPNLHRSPLLMRVAIKNAWSKFVQHWRRGRPKKNGRTIMPPHKLEYIQVWELHKSGYPHLHVLIRGDYIPQPYLRQWMIKAGVGQVVDVRKISDPRLAAAEVMKYTMKAANSTADALEGSRIITTSRNYKPNALDEPTDENCAGYTWVRLNLPARDLYSFLHGHLRYQLSPGSLPFRMEFVPTVRDHLLTDLINLALSYYHLPG